MNRSNGHATRARWVRIDGPGKSSPVSLTILGHPNNYDAPQRIRIWDVGPLFFNFVPAQENAFAIKPGETSEMRYRLVIADNVLDKKEIEKSWSVYTANKSITFELERTITP